MQEFIQLTVAGLAIGSIYALVALGFVLIYTTVDVVNFAQGDFAMIGAYFMVTCVLSWGLPWWLAFVISVVLAAIAGVVFQLLIYQPVKNRPRSFVPILIATVGASIFIEQAYLIMYGAVPYQVPGMFSVQTVSLGGITLYSQYLAIIVITAALVVLLSWFLEKTKTGLQMQATAQDPDTAKLMGIHTAWIAALVFAISAGTGGLAGILVAPVFNVSISMGSSIALKAFAAAVVGGFSSVRGSIIGGLIIGLVETYGATYISGSYRDAFAFIVLIVFLVFRPYGLFGEKTSDKV
ncbi:MAG: branched-chain amino acid ABC transporter permease [Salinisphaera sp.]|jgi:branched-chain amino acid transport system permease protein|nr:branched-chain amino acid ABC transporter permease [Salinisphaera sp.]